MRSRCIVQDRVVGISHEFYSMEERMQQMTLILHILDYLYARASLVFKVQRLSVLKSENNWSARSPPQTPCPNSKPLGRPAHSPSLRTLKVPKPFS